MEPSRGVQPGLGLTPALGEQKEEQGKKEQASTGEPTWDGRDLGAVEAEGKGVLWLPEYKMWALSRSKDIERRVLTDELKPLFGLTCFCTARATINGRARLLIPLGEEAELPLRYATLPKDEQKAHIEKLRAVLVVREVLGLRPAPLCVATDGHGETHLMCPPEPAYPHSQDWLNKPAVVARYWPKGDYEQWGKTYLEKALTDRFVDHLEEVIVRVDPDLIWVRSYILDRLRLFGFTPR